MLEYSREQTALISWHHVFDVNVGVFATVPLHQLKCLLDHVADVIVVLLSVVDFVTQILVSVSQEVHHGQNLSVVGDKGLGYGIR